MDSSSGEFGIQDSAGFAAFVRAYQPVQLFTRFFTTRSPSSRSGSQAIFDDGEAGAALGRLTISGPPVLRADGHPDYDDAGCRVTIRRVHRNERG